MLACVLQILKPDAIYFHTDMEPVGLYWEQTKLIPSLRVNYRKPPTQLFGETVKTPMFYTSHSNVDRVKVSPLRAPGQGGRVGEGQSGGGPGPSQHRCRVGVWESQSLVKTLEGDGQVRALHRSRIRASCRSRVGVVEGQVPALHRCWVGGGEATPEPYVQQIQGPDPDYRAC